ncbi:rhomboid family intramembrane serine protease [Pontibacter fetidus]|uniref:Rhomboid family intramembrane serine protease n=1 Tax=Pontibacter fetidus TaxID=2700082 RepID=A0A6B2H6S1_9BACT|nr:rhomboid family intramembrane serine protease [Pontibacter fetidus]NDK56546.1 rhomboid family intramembrane serine protease [Pontibacter fetidus]
MRTGQGVLESTQQESSRFAYSFLPGLLFVLLLWLIHLLAYLTHADLGFLGVFPRHFLGLVGVFVGPLIHADLKHLLSNSFPLVLLSGFVLFIHRLEGTKVIAIVYLLSGLLTWFIGRQAHHIGASGVVYGLAGYLLFRGIFTRDRSALAIAFVVLILYSGLFYGLFPNEERVSWEGHLAGMAAGLVAALFYGHKPTSSVAETDETIKVNAATTQLHVNSTFIPYYLNYTINYTVANNATTTKPFVYTIAPDQAIQQKSTVHQHPSIIRQVRTPKLKQK